MKWADALYEYLLSRYNTHPPNAYPDSRDPHPSEEQLKIKECQDYDRKTQEYYDNHFRIVMVGIIREYAAKGAKTGSLESDFSNTRVPYVGATGSPMEFNGLDDLSRFRELAWHIDAHDNLIVF